MEFESKTICNVFVYLKKMNVFVPTVATQYWFLFATIFELLSVDCCDN